MKALGLAAFALSILIPWSTIATPLERSLSPSEQFVIYGEDSLSRGLISILAEKTKGDLLGLLRRPDNWKTPIVINLQSAQANIPEIPPAALRFSQTGFGLKLQLDLTIDAHLNRAAIEPELLRAILLEMIYRNEPNLAAGATYVQPADWFLDGLLACAPGRDRQALIDALAATDRVISLEDFLRERPEQLDSPGRELYRGYSFALMQLLLERENGRAVGRYIDNLSRATNDPVADLKQQFPELAGPDSATIWAAELARMKIDHDRQLLSFAETERQLEELLKSKIPDPAEKGDGSLLRELARRKISSSERAALIKLKLDLLLLATRANPILRPTIQDYQQIAQILAVGKRKGAILRLDRVDALRVRIVARMSDIDDFMNWFEATQLKENSGLFLNYVSAAKEQGEAQPRRRDPLSIYLDALEEQF
ncbi:MAG TPA: hypothetical protein VEI58_08325 [Chthoniobacterales bacterium]|nr:hypothetical protein [Chthoniobacterales bacterium]